MSVRVESDSGRGLKGEQWGIALASVPTSPFSSRRMYEKIGKRLSNGDMLRPSRLVVIKQH